LNLLSQPGEEWDEILIQSLNDYFATIYDRTALQKPWIDYYNKLKPKCSHRFFSTSPKNQETLNVMSQYLVDNIRTPVLQLMAFCALLLTILFFLIVFTLGIFLCIAGQPSRTSNNSLDYSPLDRPELFLGIIMASIGFVIPVCLTMITFACCIRVIESDCAQIGLLCNTISEQRNHTTNPITGLNIFSQHEQVEFSQYFDAMDALNNSLPTYRKRADQVAEVEIKIEKSPIGDTHYFNEGKDNQGSLFEQNTLNTQNGLRCHLL